jgi:hypothetical protein
MFMVCLLFIKIGQQKMESNSAIKNSACAQTVAVKSRAGFSFKGGENMGNAG